MAALPQTLGVLTALVAALCGVLLFAIFKFAGRSRKRPAVDGSSESLFVADALGEAVSRLRTQERAQQARAEASERLNADIVRNLASGLIVVKGDGAISSVNPAATALIGVEATEIGRPFDEVLGGVPEIAGLVAEGLRTGHPAVRRSVDLRAMRPRPGAAATLDVSVSPLFAKDGLFEGAICLLTDLSAVYELEAQLRLKDGLARLGELAAGIAHEFRNGLATIHGYSRLMPLDRLPDDLHPHILGIQQETTALGGVVTRFLEFARPAPLSVAPVALRDLLLLALREVEPALNEAGGTLEIEGQAPSIDGDAVLLQRALVNVLRNALDACARVPVRPKLRAVFAHTEAPSGLTMRLLDNGSGFTRESEARAFEPFFTTRADGTGLGLALVQKFVLLHGGRVSVENREAAGAAVSIWLPLHQT